MGARQALHHAGQPVSRALSALFSGLLDAVLPQGCAGCGLRLPAGGDAGLCQGCVTALPGRAVPRCRQCALALAAATPAVLSPIGADRRCQTCARQDRNGSVSLVLCDYASPVDQMIHALKFGRHWALGSALGSTLGSCLRDDLYASLPACQAIGPSASPPIWVCAVPLGPTRIVERGFNQSELIARGLVRAINTRQPPGVASFCYRQLLRRTRDTPPQSLLGLNERHNNLQGAFVARRPCVGATVIVVDDVMTSGATLASAQQALQQAGAGLVLRVALARAT